MDQKFNLFWNHSAPLIGRVSTVRPLQNIVVLMFSQCIAMMNDDDMLKLLMPTQEFPDRIWLAVVDRTQPKDWGEMRSENEKQQRANDD